MDDAAVIKELRCLKAHFGFDFVGIALVLGARCPLLTWRHAVGFLNTRYRRIVLEPGKGIAGGVYKSGRPMIIQNVKVELDDPRKIEHPITISENLLSTLAVPLYAEGTVQGTIMGAFRTADKITPALFSEFMSYLQPAFCGYTVDSNASYYQSLRSATHTEAETVPVYELMSYHILRAQEEERRRISRELHDGVVQEILGVQMLLRTLEHDRDQTSAQGVYRQIDSHLTQIQNSLRSMSAGLRPTILDDLGLVAAFRSHFHWVGENHGVMVQFHENMGGARFDAEMETVFYRVCQESVLNACKYSGCHKIEVRLIQEEGYLTLEVTDCGVGFDPDDFEIRGTGLGIPGMAEWSDLIDGELTFQAAPHKGVSVWLTAAVKGGIRCEDCHCR